MRILIVTNTYPPADITGVGALAVELARALGATGHEVRVLTRDPPVDDPYAIGTGGGKLLFPLRAALCYLRLRPRFDLVHVHESDGSIVIVLARLLRLFGLGGGDARLVATLQVSYVRERRVVRPVCANGVVVSVPTPSERVFAWLRAPVHAFLGRVTARLADAVVAPSRETARELIEDYGATVRAVVANGLGTPPEITTTTTLDVPGRPLILYAGRLRTRKAVAVLLVAFHELLSRQPECGLVVAGDGDHRPQLDALAARLGLGERVRFVGAVPRDEMTRWYANADVFCLPSTYEGFPVAILEAMAHGLAVVSTRVAGIPEAVADGETGYVVEPEDGHALAAALERLVVDPELRSRMGAAGRARFEREFHVDVIVRAYGRVYGDVGSQDASDPGSARLQPGIEPVANLSDSDGDTTGD